MRLATVRRPMELGRPLGLSLRAPSLCLLHVVLLRVGGVSAGAACRSTDRALRGTWTASVPASISGVSSLPISLPPRRLSSATASALIPGDMTPNAVAYRASAAACALEAPTKGPSAATACRALRPTAPVALSYTDSVGAGEKRTVDPHADSDASAFAGTMPGDVSRINCEAPLASAAPSQLAAVAGVVGASSGNVLRPAPQRFAAIGT